MRRARLARQSRAAHKNAEQKKFLLCIFMCRSADGVTVRALSRALCVLYSGELSDQENFASDSDQNQTAEDFAAVAEDIAE